MRKNWWVSCGVLPVAVLIAACGGQAVDVGSNGNDRSGSPSTKSTTDDSLPAGDPLPVWPDPATCQAGSASVSGTWTGYVQGMRPIGVPNGDFQITLSGDADALCGTLLFGEPVNFAPPTDPKAAFPGGYHVSAGTPKEIYTGYSYALLSGTLSGQRLRLQFSWTQRWREWCELQTPYYDAGMGWICAPNIAYVGNSQAECQGTLPSGSHYTASCDQVNMCQSGLCACNQQACTATSSYVLNFDVVLNGAGDGAQGDFDGSTAVLTKN